MKRLSFLLLFLLLITLNVFSQRGTNIGINGSFNSTWVFWPNAYGIKQFINTKPAYYKPSYGYDASFALGHNFGDIVGVRAEIGTSSQNQKLENTKDTSTRDISLKYLQIPIMLRLASTGQRVKIHIMLGPQFGFISSADQTNTTLKGINTSDVVIKDYQGKEVDYFKTENIKDRYNKMDLLAVIDLGLDIFLTDKLLLNLGVRVHTSLKDINKNDWKFNDSPDVDYNGSRNVYGGVNVGLTYSLKNWYSMKK